MGSCCDLFSREGASRSDNRLKLLGTKVQARNHSPFDPQFTYYLHYFDQHAYLERILREYRQSQEQTDDSGTYSFDQVRLKEELAKADKYLKDLEDKQSTLCQRISKDSQAIKRESRKHPEGDHHFQCMVKMEIQDFQMMEGISGFKVRRIFRGKEKDEKVSEQLISVGRVKEAIFRQFFFPTKKGAKIQMISDPIEASVTIDVEDILRQEAVCNVYRFQQKDHDIGFIALRLQFFTNQSAHSKMRKEKLMYLQRELKLCLQKACRGSLSQSISEAASHKDTFISDPGSQFVNDYRM